MSKALGVLTVAAVGRTTFGVPFEVPRSDRWTRRTRTDRVREFSRNLLSAAAWLAGGILVVAAFDDAYGTGRLAALGPWLSTAIVSAITGVLLVRSITFVSERHAPGRQVRGALLRGLALRILVATPIVLLLFDETFIVGLVLAIFWLPAFLLFALRFSYGTERRALSDIDPSLHTPQAQAALSFSEIFGPSVLVAGAAFVLFVICLLGIETGLRALGLEGPLIGPVGDYLNIEFFEPGLVFQLIGRDPLFAATFVAAGLFAYQIARVAWFFVYVDARVRRDCWDLELVLAREAKRLEGE
jgi:hypothetical protein